jgi:hypothetical protein
MGTNDDSDAEMERGIAQTMNTMAPGAVFSYAGRGITMKVDDWYAEPLPVEDEGRIRDRVAGQIEPFRNADDEAPWQNFDEVKINFRRVQQVESEFFPRTVVCKQCSAVTYRNDAASLRETDGTCPRADCDGDLQQLQFVLVHDCGALTNLEPDPCDTGGHGFNYLYLDRGAPEDLGTWALRCDGLECDYESDLGGLCNGCNEYISFPTPVEAGTVHYAQRDAFAEMPMIGVEPGDVPYGEEWSRVLMTGYLSKPDYRSEGIAPESVAAVPGLSEDELEEYIDQVGEENRSVILDMVQNLTPGEGYTRNTIVKLNRDDVTAPDDAEWHTLVADQLFTFMRCTDGYSGDPADLEDIENHPTSSSLDDYVRDEAFIEKHPEAKLYRDYLSQLGVQDAWVVDNFPLLNILYGYTRDSPRASATDLRAFDHPFQDDGISIYGDRSPSEAIVLEFDRAKIVEWLLQNGSLSAPAAPDLGDGTDIKRWFLENVDPRETQNPFTPIKHQLTEEVYTLLHTASHALMSTASEQCGLDSDSISELIMPNVPAVILYAKSMEHFALGGMFTLFKTRINDWVTDTKGYVENCIYDPACQRSDGGAACHACMHVSEFTCEYYNQTLDRNVLVGAKNIDPFWEL